MATNFVGVDGGRLVARPGGVTLRCTYVLNAGNGRCTDTFANNSLK